MMRLVYVMAFAAIAIVLSTGFDTAPSVATPHDNAVSISVPPPQIDVPTPETCCGDDCKCCAACPCNGKESTPAPKQVTKAEPRYKVGQWYEIGGRQQKLVEVTVANGAYQYRFQYPLNQPVQTQTTVASSVDNYTPRWRSYDGLSRVDHARAYHGLNTSGMTLDQVEMTLDADHDRYGGGHSAIQSSRGGSVNVRYQSPVFSNGSCPGGVCPTSPRRGLFGWR